MTAALPKTMRALRLLRWQSEPELVEVPVPRPGPGEALIEVRASGLCHSDLHLMDWPEGRMPFPTPFTLGHETAGVVAALGEGTDAVEVGEPVLIYGPWGCGACEQCARGHENVCRRRFLDGCGGVGRDGGLAEYVLVPSTRLLLPLGDLDPAEAAPLTDAALTSFHAIEMTKHLIEPDELVVVIGAGGLGHLAIQLLKRSVGARVLALDLRADALELARRAAADEVLQIALDEDGSTVTAAYGPGCTRAALDFVGTDASVALGTSLLAPGGQLTMVGAGGASLPDVFRMLSPDRVIAVATWGTRPELEELLDIAHSGALHIEVERLGLDDAMDGYRRMREGSLVGRAVVCPGETPP